MVKNPSASTGDARDSLGLDSWVKKTPWSRKWQLTPIFLPGKSHSNFLAWEIAWTGEPGRLQSMGLQRDGHDLATSLSLSLFPS